MYLGNGYHITADRYQYILEKHMTRKDGNNIGQDYVAVSTYHPTVCAACNWLLRQLQREDIQILNEAPEEVVDAFKRRVEEVREMFRKCENLEMKDETDQDNSKEETD